MLLSLCHGLERGGELSDPSCDCGLNNPKPPGECGRATHSQSPPELPPFLVHPGGHLLLHPCPPSQSRAAAPRGWPHLPPVPQPFLTCFHRSAARSSAGFFVSHDLSFIIVNSWSHWCFNRLSEPNSVTGIAGIGELGGSAPDFLLPTLDPGRQPRLVGACCYDAGVGVRSL